MGVLKANKNTAVKTTLVLSLDNEAAAFLDSWREQAGEDDPNALINRLLKQERDRLGLPARHRVPSAEQAELENSVDKEIPSAG